MSNLPLFSVESLVSAPAPIADPQPSDIRRRLQHKSGPFRALRTMTEAERADSKTPHQSLITGEYYIVELYDERVFAEFVSTKERRKAHGITVETIEAHLRSGEWREVAG